MNFASNNLPTENTLSDFFLPQSWMALGLTSRVSHSGDILSPAQILLSRNLARRQTHVSTQAHVTAPLTHTPSQVSTVQSK